MHQHIIKHFNKTYDVGDTISIGLLSEKLKLSKPTAIKIINMLDDNNGLVLKAKRKGIREKQYLITKKLEYI